MTRNLRYLLFPAALLLAGELFTPWASAEAISMNVGRRNNNLPNPLAATDVAGAYAAANWNDRTIAFSAANTPPTAPPTTVVDSNGTLQPSTSITFAGIGSFLNNRTYNYGPTGNAANDANLHLMDSFYEASANPSPFGRIGFTAAAIPYAKYDLYVYIDAFGPFSAGTAVSQWDISTGGVPITTVFAVDSAPSGFSGSNYQFSEYHASTLAAAQAEYAAAPTGQHNYFKVSGLTAANLTVIGINATAPGTVGNPGINALQIVNAVPEPGALALGAVALAGSLIAMRRRS